MLNFIFINILSMSTIASIVFLFILLARKCISKKVNFRRCSLLWIIFIISLLIPLNFESKLSIKNYIQTDKKYTLNPTEIFYSTEIYEGDKLALEIKNNRIIYADIFSLIWLIVTLSLIFKDIYIYNTCINKNESFEIPKRVLYIFEDLKKELNIEKDIKLVVQNKIKMPSLYGILDSKILISEEILNFSDIELKCILVHELNHYKNNHHIFYLIFSIIEKIHWFNPFIRLAFKIIKEDLEIITDSNVINSNFDIKEYCKTILKVAKICTLTNYKMPSICSTKNEIERRIKEMKNKSSYAKSSILILVVTIITISLLTVSLASDKVENKNEIQHLNDIFEYIETEEKVEYILPIEYAKVSVKFGRRIHPITKEERFHSGIDLIAEEGTKVKATADGIVEVVTYDSQKGNYVEIRHKDGSISSYQHGSEILVNVGDSVNAGDYIMLVGKTGMATGAHLHFELRSKDGEYLDVNSMFE